MAIARSQLVDLEVTPYYHVISRCVRRAHLCGWDRTTRRSFAHRKRWLTERIGQLVRCFAIEVYAYAIMGNHYHLVVGIDQPRVATWSDDEVLTRWGRLFPASVRRLDHQPQAMRKAAVEQFRQRLASLSWFMKCLNEAIARRANREDGCTGRFWEGRFKSQALLDEAALVACMAYVDLNPIRAGLARRLTHAEYTSVSERLGLCEHRRISCPSVGLAPFIDAVGPLVGASSTLDPQRLQAIGPVPICFADYLELLDATVVCCRRAQAQLPESTERLLRKLRLQPKEFVANFLQLSRGFFRMIGAVERFELMRKKASVHWFKGVRAARRLYSRAA